MPAPETQNLWRGLAILGRVAALRFLLLVRQKLGWGALVGGAACVFLSLLFSQASFMSPRRIFWDFTLGSSFLLQALFVIYLGSQLFSEERNRRTMHLLLASGVPRWAWLSGNALGLWTASTLLSFAWLVIAALFYVPSYGDAPWTVVYQAQWALSVEMLIVVFGSVLFSLWVRPLLAFAGSLAVFAFLHSASAIEGIFTDKQSGHLITATLLRPLLQAVKFLPPLEWFDLRVLVGYQDAVAWSSVGTLTLLGFLWAALLAGLSVWRFERMDL